MKYALVALVFVAGCEKDKPQAAPAAKPLPVVDKTELVNAMRAYCRIGELPKDKQRDAQKTWGWQNPPAFNELWTRAARDKDPAAIAAIWAATDEAVGKGNCPILDVLGK